MKFLAGPSPAAGPLKPDDESGGLKPSGTALGFMALSVGILLTWALARMNSRIDHRVLLMILGMLSASLFNTENLLGRSRSEFMELLGPAFTIAGMLDMNTKMLSEMAGKFVVYATLGMVMCAALNGAAMKSIIHCSDDLSWKHLMGLGAIIAYPNFAPVRRMLKQFGVTSRVGISISGETMFNSIALGFLKNMGDSKKTSHWLDVFMQGVVQESLGGYAVGVGFGILFLWVIELANRKHSETDRTLQVVLTIFLAYSAWHGSIYILQIGDGICALLFASLILSWRMWAVLVAPMQMRNFWGIIEFGADTFNAFIQGAVLAATFRSSFENLDGGDIIMRIVALWAAITFGRLAVFIVLSPVIDTLGRPMSWREKVLWAWLGTVKGKLGITASMYTALKHFNDPDPAMKAFNTSLLLYGGGVTFLSLLINATLTPLLIAILSLDGRNRPESQLKNELGKRILRHRVVDQLGTETGVNLLKRKCPDTWEFLQAKDEAIELLDKVDSSFYISMMREVFLELARRNYLQLCEGKSRRVIRIVSATLLESTLYGKDRCSVGLHDWDILKDCLPELMSEIVFILHCYLAVQRLSQGQLEDTCILKLSGIGKQDFFSRGMAVAWDAVQKESNKNCRSARKLLSKLDINEVRLSAERQAAWDVCDVLEDQGGHLGSIGLFHSSDVLLNSITADVRGIDRVRSGESKSIDVQERVNESEEDEEDVEWGVKSMKTLDELRSFAIEQHLAKDTKTD